MALRWYAVVVDCRDVASQARWWARTLGWRIAYEAPDEVVIVPAWLTREELAQTPWERRGQGIIFVPVPEGKVVKNRLHLDLAPGLRDDRDAIIAGLIERGASRADVGQDPESVSWTVMADPEGNEFCVLSARDD